MDIRYTYLHFQFSYPPNLTMPSMVAVVAVFGRSDALILIHFKRHSSNSQSMTTDELEKKTHRNDTCQWLHWSDISFSPESHRIVGISTLKLQIHLCWHGSNHSYFLIQPMLNVTRIYSPFGKHDGRSEHSCKVLKRGRRDHGICFMNAYSSERREDRVQMCGQDRHHLSAATE